MKRKYIAPRTESVELSSRGALLEFMSADASVMTGDVFSRQPNRRLWDDDDEDEDWY